MLNWLENLFSPPEPAGPPRLIQRFDGSQATISSSSIIADTEGWHINTDESVTVRLFELDPGDIENGMVTYRASIKSEAVKGQGYLEMWCRLPGQGEFFSKGLDNTVKGSNDWASYEIPFYLKKNQNPDLLKLNFTLEGGGKVWLKDIEVDFTPFK
jgi:hypothetical protein